MSIQWIKINENWYRTFRKEEFGLLEIYSPTDERNKEEMLALYSDFAQSQNNPYNTRSTEQAKAAMSKEADNLGLEKCYQTMIFRQENSTLYEWIRKYSA